MTLKTGLEFFQGHWKWHLLIDRIRVPIENLYSPHNSSSDKIDKKLYNKDTKNKLN